MIYDSHCHLDLMNNMESMIEELKNMDIGVFAVSTTPKAYVKDLELCKKLPNVCVGLGMHPQLVSTRYEDIDMLDSYISKSRYIGEIGLDFSSEYFDTKLHQIEIFEHIIELCEKYGTKTVSIHSKKSTSKIIKILNNCKLNNNNKYILHWYTGTVSQMKDALELGCYFSINPKMLKTRSGCEIISKLPLDRLLIETDAPFTKEYNSAKLLEIELYNLIVELSELKNINVSNYIQKNEEFCFK